MLEPQEVAPSKAAVIVVHGVCPHPRYEIQDAFASGLQDTLNTQQHLGKQWKTAILWPTISHDECGPEDVHASALRVYAADDDPTNPTQPTWDVFEGYWSPIDKNQTNVASVLQWLLQSLFQPLNGYTKLWASTGKTIFDMGYLGIALLLLVIGLGLTFLAASAAWHAYVSSPLTCAAGSDCSKATLLGLFTDTKATLSALGIQSVIFLVVTLVGAYCAWNLVFSVFMDFQRLLRPDHAPGGRTSWRHYLQALLLLVAVGCFWLVNAQMHSAGRSALWLVLSVGLLKGSLAFISNFLINFLGDVQIYCTHDENARFYQFRDKMVQTVEGVILEVLRSPADRPPNTTVLSFRNSLKTAAKPALLYDKVFVAGHSLGSTIAMDAILKVHELVEEQGVDVEDWRRLRALITFGTALEKTRFFFDVRNPSLSASITQWRDDVSGHLFTGQSAVVEGSNAGGTNKGIYWANYWYFFDIVANEIASYRSTIPAGADPDDNHRMANSRLVCKNARLRSAFLRPPYHVWTHGDYLGDAQFWNSGNDKYGVPYLGVSEVLRL